MSGRRLAYAPLNALRDAVVDTFRSASRGSVAVQDPYRWLEEEQHNTQLWVQQQVDTYNAFTDRHCRDQSNNIARELEKRWNYERFGCPFKRGPMMFFFHNSGLQNQSVLYAQKAVEEEKFVVLDPNVSLSWSEILNHVE